MLKIFREAIVVLLAMHSLVVSANQTDFASYSPEQALLHSQAAIGNTLSGIELVDEHGATVTFADYAGKPLVLSMIYTSCHHVCPSTTQYLNQVVQKARDALDEDSINVISVGFDTAHDTPERMGQFRKQTAVSDPNWDFLSGSEENIAELSRQLGFIFYPSTKGFEHLVQSSIIDSDGRIYRHVYGITFETPLLIEPLKDLAWGRERTESSFNTLKNRIRLFCTVYDPATDAYRIDISVFIGTFVGIVVSILFGSVLFKEWRRTLRADR